ncbi:MAG TPA: 16S rRNA (adenine(1518)-N(6)/adenine(1519)-N(6))-dimethyltransferase RsmA [Candidatus Wujingus californicus]|uniref:16S rRNA (adenine(1518)-N(6)/adenine(1519)-N(6))- dimethyltransferase RsmA n=2 Tax=Candidatus Wujingus californicus TaxID=3367618 RepID=UPI001D97DA6D|nr:ribosomal RNA small subunit methyltransferase A [Planctomycetota bacterium]MDO8132154.1 16S rRNA (adenine(1518)-N(6)/adenine(1519)-N(6))-dimethyltransferase RsmA [Candidatus Brocadiales bacterium]
MPEKEINFIPHTPAVLKQILKKRGIVLNKRFGQNILIDQHILLSIPDIAELKDNDVVLEIGTGTGGLTRLLAEKSRHVFTVEVDKGLFELSTDILRYYKNVTVLNADILKTKHELNPEIISLLSGWLKNSGQTHIKIVSNLPYNISTPVIINFLESKLPVISMTLTLQREITDRLKAIPGTREYGILSIIAQLFSDVKVVRTLPPEVFWPRPDVYSAIVRIIVNREKYAGKIVDYLFFKRIVDAIFTSRRKTLPNSLEHMKLSGVSRDCLKKIISDMQLDERIRGEVLSVEQLLQLTENVHRLLEQTSNLNYIKT